MSTALASLGLIAGNRTLPLEFARQARAAGVEKIVAIAFEDETEPELAKLVDEIVWLRVGQLSKLIAALTDRGVQWAIATSGYRATAGHALGMLGLPEKLVLSKAGSLMRTGLLSGCTCGCRGDFALTQSGTVALFGA